MLEEGTYNTQQANELMGNSSLVSHSSVPIAFILASGKGQETRAGYSDLPQL
jgi:hypothetical protein